MKKWFWGPLSSRLTQERFHFLTNVSRGRNNSTNFAENINFLNFWHTTPFASRFFVSLRPMNPRPALIGNAAPERRRRPHVLTTYGHGNGPAGRKLGWKEKWMDSVQLAMIEAPQKLQEISDMIWIAKLTFCGGIPRILFCPMVLCLDGEVVWSNLEPHSQKFAPTINFILR
jgi:hypothetical protein